MRQSKTFRQDAVSSRVPELDSLRALAIVMVLIYHSRWQLWGGWLRPALNYTLWGVDLFFVLSGYLITNILIRNSGREGFFRVFYWRRALRIFPIYYLTILVMYFVPARVTGLSPFRTDSLISQLLYAQYIPAYWGDFSIPPGPWLEHGWSLAVEEQFYLLWPAAFLLIPRRAVLPVLGTLIAAAFTARFLGLYDFLLLTRCDGLAIGAGLAILLDRAERADSMARFRSVATRVLLYAIAGLVAIYAIKLFAQPTWWHKFKNSYLLLVFDLMCAYVVSLIVMRQASGGIRILRIEPLPFIGLISYGIYMYHNGIFHWFANSRLPLVPAMLAAGLLSVVVAVISWFLIEKPFLLLKNHFEYGSPPVRSPAQSTTV
jgi:peptidoglycan/LPS O-acetylase OafA/YrhL